VILATGRALEPETVNVTLLGNSKVALLEEMVISAGFFSTTTEGDGEGRVVGVRDGEGVEVGVAVVEGVIEDTMAVTDGIKAAVTTGDGAAAPAVGEVAGVTVGRDAPLDDPQAAKPSSEVNMTTAITMSIQRLFFITQNQQLLTNNL
jgi:hypothetical protein